MLKERYPEVAALKSHHDFRPTSSHKIALFSQTGNRVCFQGLILRSIFDSLLVMMDA